jgi:hypothetical protein
VGLWTAPEGTFTIEEFQRLPLEGRRWELLDGAVVQMEPHGMDTSALTASITFAIGRHVRESNLGVVYGEGTSYTTVITRNAGDAGVAPTGAGFPRAVPDSSHPLKTNETLDGSGVLPRFSVPVAEIFS